MTINGYIKNVERLTFVDLPFNYVDGLILSELAYINFDLILAKRKEIILKDILDEEMKKDVFEGSVDASKNKKMLQLMKASPRYQDLKFGHIKRSFSHEDANQFYALTITFPDGTLFLSYRGTDTTLIGWKEDAFLSFRDYIPSQEQALTYARNVLRKNNNKFYLGGHSKGGNLAFYTALHLSLDKSHQLIETFSYDGPGFKEGIDKYPCYLQVKDKLIKFRTYNDVVGSFFNNMKKYKVVHSTGILFGGHDPFYWQIDKNTNDFKYAKDISKASRKYSHRVMRWLESLTYEDRKLAAEALFEVFKDNITIYDLFKNFLINIININKSLNKYSKEERKRLRAIIRRFFLFLIDSSKVKDFKKKQRIVDRELKD